MTNIKLIAVDLDGTLLKSDKTIAPLGASALKQAVNNGVYVVLATARRLPSVQKFAAHIGISHPVICSDGALILSSPTGEVWQKKTIPLEVAKVITALADKHRWELAIVVDGITHLKQRLGQMLGHIDEHRVVVASCAEMLIAEPSRILAYDVEAMAQLSVLVQELQKQYPIRYETFRDAEGNIRSCGIFPIVDKGAALELVAKKLHLLPENIMAIGDERNDLAMFAIAGISIAMGNALDYIKQVADYVAPLNDDEGVAWAVKRFVLDLNE